MIQSSVSANTLFINQANLLAKRDISCQWEDQDFVFAGCQGVVRLGLLTGEGLLTDSMSLQAVNKKIQLAEIVVQKQKTVSC